MQFSRLYSSIPAESLMNVSDVVEEKNDQSKSSGREAVRKNFQGKPYTPSDLATSLSYLKSDVYKNTYRGKPVWFYYRRNFKGHFAPPRTRPSCVVVGKLVSSNPCPICRDEFLVLDYRNTELLKQFIDPISSEVLGTSKTGLCQRQHKKLVLEIEKAQDLGTIETWLPFHLYDYSEYYSYLPKEQLEELIRSSGCYDIGRAPTDQLSSADFAELPVNLQDLLLSIKVIPQASDGSVREEKVEIERPKVPNRYKMEEDYKKLVSRRRKSRTLIWE